MDTLELSVATVEEGASLAAAQWGVDASEVQVTVLEEIKGLFGKPGKLKVKAERASAKPAKPARAPKAAKPAKAEPAPEPEAAPAEQATEEPAAEAKPVRKSKTPKKQEEAAAAPASDEAPAAEVVASAEDEERILEILNSLFEDGDLKATATVSQRQGRYINVAVDGKDASFLVGRRGDTLNALQYLCNVIASRHLEKGVRVTLDGNGYRNRREEVLTKLAQDIAEQVRERGEEAVLDALPAFERRLVHKALGEFEGVVTYSEGEEPNRRVVIAPAD